MSVDTPKQRRLTDVALFYLQSHHLLGQAARFDVVILSWPAEQRRPQFAHYRNAFEPVGRFQFFI
jgi:Holliday junction resolvase-like predicted endonuclease